MPVYHISQLRHAAAPSEWLIRVLYMTIKKWSPESYHTHVQLTSIRWGDCKSSSAIDLAISCTATGHTRSREGPTPIPKTQEDFNYPDGPLY
jgi:hypothetical protein